MLKTRVVTAALLLPFVLGTLIFGSSGLVATFIFFCLLACLFEVLAMLLPAIERAMRDPAKVERKATDDANHQKIFQRSNFAPMVVALVIASVLFIASVSGHAASGRGLIVVSLMSLLLIGMFMSRNIELAAVRSLTMIVSVVYAAFPWLVVWDLYEMGDHSRYILLLAAIVWAGDTGGYFGGRALGGKIFGERKLAPHISPKKTWEGAITGIVASVLGALLVNACFGNSLSSLEGIIAAGVLGGMFGQLGDLVESMLKRFAGVKDSGALLPGHGGFLDRVDGILFAAPAVWMVINLYAAINVVL